MREKSIVGFWLALIGGILGILGGIVLLFVPQIASIITTTPIGKNTFFIAQGIIYIIFSALVILGSFWMKNAKTCKRGGLFAVIFGVLSGMNVLSIVGGALGIAAGSK